MSLGDYVKEGADLVNLESIDPLKVDFRVPEIYMRQVEVGQSLQLQLDAMPGKIFDGASNGFDLFANLTAPIFHGGTLKAEKRGAEAGARAAAENYQQVVLEAFGLECLHNLPSAMGHGGFRDGDVDVLCQSRNFRGEPEKP